MKRSGRLRRARRPMRRTRRLRPVSRKVAEGRAAYQAVYDEVDARSGGRCEVTVRGGCVDTAWGMFWLAERCERRAVEHHHTRKPRRTFHAPEWIMHICRRHHDQATAPYAQGRLITEPRGDGTFACRIERRTNKWQR